MKKEVIIEKEDIKKLLYFIISMFQRETIHRQGTSSKSDFIGGYIDRWINKLPEELIFRKGLLLDKDYSVVNDYFIYGAESEKNAPDILGLKVKDKIIKFAEFHDDKWEQVENMPHIEVKTFKKNQKMVAIRETQLNDNDYYVFVETDLINDYLVKTLSDEMLEASTRENILMSETFIVSNKKNIIIQPPEINCVNKDYLGTLSVINIIKGKDFKIRATKCEAKENVYYLKNIENVSRVTKKLDVPIDFVEKFKFDSKMKMYCSQWNDKKIISMYADNVDKLKILKFNKKNFYCQSSVDCSIYKFQLKANEIYRVDLEEFERSSGWTEYIALKNQFEDSLDKTEELINIFDNLVKSNRW